MKDINQARLAKAREINRIGLKIESKESARLKLLMQTEKLDTELYKLYEEMNKIHQEIFLMSNPQDNKDDDDGYYENAVDVVD